MLSSDSGSLIRRRWGWSGAEWSLRQVLGLGKKVETFIIFRLLLQGENQLLLVLVPQNHGDSCTKSTVHETSVQSHPELADPIRHLLAQVELVWAQNSRTDLQNGSLADDQQASKQGQREAQHCPRQEAGSDCPESSPGKKSNQLAPQT